MREIKNDFLGIANSDKLKKRKIAAVCFSEVDSTNSAARRYAEQGGKAPALFVADTQSAGRGRMGRSFFSPAKTGVYMTLLIDATDKTAECATRVTTAAAVAVARVCERATGSRCEIKWVNDVYSNGKKVCGILAESFFVEKKRYVCVGVGINLCTQAFPDELEGIAGSLADGYSDRERAELAVSVATELFDSLESVDRGDVSHISEYRERSCVLGKRVVFLQNGIAREGLATDIDADGGLTVALDGGETVVLRSGEITLRVKAEAENE